MTQRCARSIALVVIMALHAVVLAAQTPVPRRFFKDTLVVQHTIGEGDDVELDRPVNLVVSSTGAIVFFEASDNQVKAYSPAGRLLWKVGRRGAGPGEFQSARMLTANASGDILVGDEDNARITVIDSAGHIRSQFPMPDELRALLPPFRGSLATGVPYGTETMLLSVLPEHRLSAGRFPAGVSPTASLVGEPYAARLGDASAVTYRWSDVIVFFNPDGSVRTVAHGVDRIPFPVVKEYPIHIQVTPTLTARSVTRVDPKAVEAVRWAAGTSDKLMLLAGGPPPDAGKILDVYDVKTTRYVGSYRFQVVPAAVGVLPDGRIVTLETEMVPVIRIWRTSATTPGPRT